MLLLLFNEKISYSFLKHFKNNDDVKEVSEPVRTDDFEIDIEDNIYIPPIKNFKEIFLRRINKENYIEITIPENVLRFYAYNYNTGKYYVKKMYPVSVGRFTRQTEIGEGIIYTKGHVYFKHHYGTNQGKLIEVGHDKDGKEFKIPYDRMYGLYMIVNHTDKFVIHSTTEYWKIGMPVSSGCVRMLIDDMLELYPLVKPVIKVYIRYKLFKLEDNLLTAYPDIYRKTTDMSAAFLDFIKNNNFDPIIFDKIKLKRFLYNELPYTIDLNDLLIDYFINHNIKVEKLKYKKFKLKITRKKEYLPVELNKFNIYENKD